MALRPVSVSQLNEYISRVLQTDPLLGNISVKGEISNLKYHSTGHVYFSMKDEQSKINCFLPASYAERLKIDLVDGMEIIVSGYINVYKKGGAYSLFIRNIEVSGEGNLAVAFSRLKEKLEKEGLFSPAHKKPIPSFPKTVGIITSETGAAVKDILKIIKSRTSLTDVIVFPVQVQGMGAAEDIAGMIDFVDRNFKDKIDTLIVGRGGGSAEDLWAFNEEVVARSVYNCSIPVISAVGHEIDFTICDFVADKRAETPTAAAEMAVPDSRELKEKVEWYKNQLLVQLNNRVRYDKLKIENISGEMENSFRRRLDEYKNRIHRLELILEENNPLAILQQGYSVMEDSHGKVVSSIGQIDEGCYYRICLKDGAATFKAVDIAKNMEREGE